MDKDDLEKLDKIDDAGEMLAEIEQYFGTEDWYEIAAYLPHTDHNLSGTVDFSDFSNAFDPLFVDSKGLCLAEFCGELILRDVAAEMDA